MESLLLVLLVIGVVMILAGVARMRKKRRYGWDDIDHSVLFTKQPHLKEEIESSVGEVRIARGEKVAKQPQPQASLSESATAHDATATEPLSGVLQIMLDEDDLKEEHDRPRARARTTDRARSILNKLKLDMPSREVIAEEEIEEPLKKVYRNNAPDKVIVLNVMAPGGRQFLGPALVDAIKANGMEYGDMQIFHRLQDDAIMFSLVNMVKPGIFDLAGIESLSTPGVSLFIQMPNASGNGVTAFNQMLATARQLAQRLGGELRDERRSVLTVSAIDHIRQQIAEYDCKWLEMA